MPAVSQAQREFLFATKGAGWVRKHHFDNAGKLPARARSKRRTHSAVAEALSRKG